MKICGSGFSIFLFWLSLFGCNGRADKAELRRELQSIDLYRGDIALCGSGETQLGTVDFSFSCSGKVKSDFNLGTALLHSFEYEDAEKVFASVIDKEPTCLMGYWGVAMSNFHPLWAPPTKEELEKGSKIIALARSLKSKDSRETDYLEAVATMFDDWTSIDHKTRLQKFEGASETVYRKYPGDTEAAIFYALALKAAADPTDKTFVKQRKAGKILTDIFSKQPDHPGVAHYIIHTFDSPQLAELGLQAARKYASIAASSAHALHMPSHIFVRLGLWEESARSNINSMEAAKCYAENQGMNAHWDEELHGLDYLVYAYLQQARDEKAKEQLAYLESMRTISPLTFKVAYSLAAVPTRYALERKDWQKASTLGLDPPEFPWERFPWERSIVAFGKVLGAVHTKNTDVAQSALQELRNNHVELEKMKKSYEANQVQIQIMASEGWIALMQGKKEEAIRLMTAAADMEDATEKHPVTPCEIIPARELLADMYMELKHYGPALKAYETDLKGHAGRLNALVGAAVSSLKSGDKEKAHKYLEQIDTTIPLSEVERPSVLEAKAFLKSKG